MSGYSLNWRESSLTVVYRTEEDIIRDNLRFYSWHTMVFQSLFQYLLRMQMHKIISRRD